MLRGTTAILLCLGLFACSRTQDKNQRTPPKKATQSTQINLKPLFYDIKGKPLVFTSFAGKTMRWAKKYTGQLNLQRGTSYNSIASYRRKGQPEIVFFYSWQTKKIRIIEASSPANAASDEEVMMKRLGEKNGIPSIPAEWQLTLGDPKEALVSYMRDKWSIKLEGPLSIP